jgi:alpha-glucosidase
MDETLWWRDGVIYQIYPRSFADRDGDGLGDLPGITARLDYLAKLGVDAIWLSPFYPTPDRDFGYDVSDHTAVDPRFGSLADFDRLLAEAHRRGIRLILDLVLNHTSDQHPWFLESRSGRGNPKSDWYLWQDRVPNNWQSVFGGRAWTYDPQRGQYYYHMFLAEQPDVNWRNPQVRQAQLDVVRFWLERGVDGFRLDVFNVYFKDGELRSNPSRLGLRAFDRQHHVHDCDQPEMMSLLNELRALLDSYPQRYAVGETFLATPEKAAGYCGPDRLHAAFNFDFTHRPFRPGQFLAAIEKWEHAAGGRVWPNYVLSNHDLPRSATRYARGEDDARARVALALLLTLRGTPFLYYGEELGMRDISLSRSQIMDPPGRKYWPLYKGRDGCRAPMQWDDSPQAGFTSGRPWLPLHPNARTRNAAAQQDDLDSLFHFTRGLIRLRRELPALQRGDFQPLTTASSPALAYLRQADGQKVLAALNFASRPSELSLPPDSWRLLLSTAKTGLTPGAGRLPLAPNQVCLLIAE